MTTAVLQSVCGIGPWASCLCITHGYLERRGSRDVFQLFHFVLSTVNAQLLYGAVLCIAVLLCPALLVGESRCSKSCFWY